MLKSIVRRAVAAVFSPREFEEALANSVAFAIDYEAVAEDVIANCEMEELVHDIAVEYAVDNLIDP